MNYFYYRVALYKLNRARDRANTTLSKQIDEARKTGGEQEAQMVYQTESGDLNQLEEEILILKTRYLRNKAEKMTLPVPPVTDKQGLWEGGRYTRRWFLTNKGMTELRQLIRKERKETFDLFLPWVSLLTGLIAAISGLILTIKK